MTNDELKAVWAADINSHEKFQEAMHKTRNHLPRLVAGVTHLLPQYGQEIRSLTHVPGDTWPLHRDMIREAIGFYPEPTSVLRWIRQINSGTGAGQMFPHVSPQDRAQIAFTPDATQGKADRKQRMTPGRFLRKFLLFVPDSEIQRLEQQHRAELDTEFLLAETVEDIQRVYMEMDGDSGCMRYGLETFSHETYHPSAVYCSPNMGVAYTEDEHSNVKSRSVVWTNPDDPSDKRYVRIYGDPILKKKLEANGFRMRGLAGAKLTIYYDDSFTNDSTVVMPWIDPAGGIHAQGVDRSYDSEHAVRFKGEDFITLVPKAQASQYQRAGIHPVDVQTQSGHVDVPEVDVSLFHYTCALTGKRTNRMEVLTVYWITDDGTVLQAREEAVHELRPEAVTLRVQREGRLNHAYCTEATQVAFRIPGYSSHFNDEPTREAAGVCELDKTFYADSERYCARSECVAMDGVDGARRFIKMADALMLYVETGDKFIHVDMVKALKAEGCVPVSVLTGYRGLAHKTHAQLVTTRTGKRVVTGRHDVIQLWDKSWDYSRNVKSMNVCGITLTIGKNESPSEVMLTEAYVRQRYTHHYVVADKDYRERVMRREMAKGYQGANVYMKSGENIVACDYYNKPTHAAHMYEAALGIMLMKDDAEWMQRTLGYQRANAVQWARVAVLAYEGMLAYDREYDLMMAEANAVEAAPSTQAVIEHLNTLGSSDMDRLIAEVDETLVTSVVRRWPRLNREVAQERPALGDPNNPADRVQVHGQPVVVTITHPGAEQHLSMSEAEDARIREQDMLHMSRPLELHHDATTGVISSAPTQAQQDDDLLAQLASAGLTPIVIDEHTDFSTLPSLT